jgi:hypothetical protein
MGRWTYGGGVFVEEHFGGWRWVVGRDVDGVREVIGAE